MAERRDTTVNIIGQELMFNPKPFLIGKVSLLLSKITSMALFLFCQSDTISWYLQDIFSFFTQNIVIAKKKTKK